MKSRKTHRANIERTIPFFFRVGLIASICLAIVAFEWETPYVITEDSGPDEWEFPVDETLPPITLQKEKPIELPKEDTKVIDKSEPLPEPNSVKKEPKTIDPVILDEGFLPGNEIPEKVEPEPFLMVSEVEPKFPGGNEALKDYLVNNVDYPRAAKEINLNGKVYLSFIVSKSGKIKDIKILKDIGGGCGDEALRVIKEMPDWIPGKQGGEKVNVQMKLCLNFGLL